MKVNPAWDMMDPGEVPVAFHSVVLLFAILKLKTTMARDQLAFFGPHISGHIYSCNLSLKTTFLPCFPVVIHFVNKICLYQDHI